MNVLIANHAYLSQWFQHELGFSGNNLPLMDSRFLFVLGLCGNKNCYCKWIEDHYLVPGLSANIILLMDSRFSVSLGYVQLWSCWFSKVASKLWENALCSDVFEWLLYTPHPHTQLCIICTIVCDCCVILCVDIKHKVSMEKQVEYMTSQIIHILIFF
jgi:hypothetical protein